MQVLKEQKLKFAEIENKGKTTQQHQIMQQLKKKVKNSEDTSPKSSNTNKKKKCNNKHHDIHNKITKSINKGVDSKETKLKSKLIFLIDNNLLRYQTP